MHELLNKEIDILFNCSISSLTCHICTLILYLYLLLNSYVYPCFSYEFTTPEIIKFLNKEIEISFIVVIYAGFRLDLAKGALLAFVFGFVLDCLTSPVIGLFTVIYILVFLCSFILSFILDIEKIHFIALFGFLCALTKEIFVIIFYNLVLNFDTVMNIPFICLPQAIIIGLLTPLFFYLMRRLEVFFYGKPFHRTERTGDSRISAKI